MRKFVDARWINARMDKKDRRVAADLRRRLELDRACPKCGSTRVVRVARHGEEVDACADCGA